MKNKFYISRLFFIITIVLSFTTTLFSGDYDNEADFKQIYTNTIKGDIAATGSPIMCADRGNGTCNWNYTGYLFDIDPLTLYDGPKQIFSKNSGGAILSLPSNINSSDILWARLYWQGHIFGTGSHADFLNAINGLDKVKLLDPLGNEHDVNATVSDIYYYGYDGKNVSRGGNNGYRYFYQASKDVTSIIKNSYDSTHNYFIVGNINATMTKDIYYIKDTKLGVNVKWGNWGGWSLIVVYKDPNTSMKNISLYDGFKFLLPPFGETASLTIDLPPNSFYTPNYGTVKSRTIIFSAGAEKKISADKLEMYSQNNGYQIVSNSYNPPNNQMNDSITYLNSEINATRIFNAGIDLDTYNTSNILSNGQTTTSIRVTMTASSNAADQAFVGFIGISNDIYQPNICYNEQLFDSSGTDINSSSVVKVGDTLKVKLTIQNNDNETADNVKIIRNFDDNKTSYETNSTVVNNIDTNGNQIGDINQTDNLGDDLTDYDANNKSLQVRLGRGANSSLGGTFKPSDKAFIYYDFRINTDQNLTLSYQTSYTFNIAGQQFTFYGQLPKCTDFDNTIHPYLPPQGIFNVVNSQSDLSSGDPTNGKDQRNALYTQVAGKAFTVKIVSLEEDKTTLKNFTGNVLIDLVDATNINQTQSSCTNAPKLKQYANTSAHTNMFNNNTTKLYSLTYNGAVRNATFRIKYYDFSNLANFENQCSVSNTSANINGVPQCLNSDTLLQKYFPQCSSLYTNVCSSQNQQGSDDWRCYECITDHYSTPVCARDNFAIRPATYSMDLIDTNSTHIGGKAYPIDINATNGSSDANISGYNQNINENSEKNATIKLSLPVGCTDLNTSSQILSNSFVFTNGRVNQPTYFSYSNIGDVNLTIYDQEWTHIDQQPYNGKTFNDCVVNSSSNTPDSNGKVGCLSKGSKVLKFKPKKFLINLSVFNSHNQNFTYISNDKNMSAKINLNVIALLDNNLTATNYTRNCFSRDINYTIKLQNDQNLSWGSKKKRISFYDDGNLSNLINDTNATADLNSSQSVFHLGIANIPIFYNFDRNITKTDEPFIVSKNDFNVTKVIDKDAVFGSDFNRTNDQNTTFYYARIHAPDYSVKGNTINAKIYREVYCKDCNKSQFGSIGGESIDSIYWYINKDDNNISNGRVFNFINSTKINTIIPSSSVHNGTETDNITYNAGIYPYSERIDINASSWLIYNQFDKNATTTDFSVEFLNNGNWAGIGSTGNTVDLNISTQNPHRIEW